MSITLYREGLPRVDIKAPHLDDREGMLVGLADMSHEQMHAVHAIVMGEDGDLHLLDLNRIRVQFHYNAETDQWVDENEREEDQE
jgi:hypothetical protein